MNADDLAAIEKRHVRAKGERWCGECFRLMPCDARRLLDELAHSGGWTADEQQNHQEHDNDIRLAERARIAEAVNRLDVYGPSYPHRTQPEQFVSRSAVLDIINKEKK